MTNTPIQITTDLSTVLERIERKLDKIDEKFEAKFDALQKEVSDFKTETFVAIESLKGDIKGVQGEIKGIQGDIKTLDTKIDGIDKRLDKVETSQKNQIWSLIVLAFTAVLGMIGALARVFWVSNP
ncbi:MAG: hypothetical protein KME17_24020 [Cyanosarcina radialis HA8281-LM2]|jgi:predicted  nucleic acid-binding Zn-ribbon protein|nr:hypothetical protein [Cyanosarcina radialis HA8281-LM2]